MDIVESIGSLYHKPLEFVYFAYPWKEEGGLLFDEEGPDVWQAGVLKDLEKASLAGDTTRVAIASGHGIGKTALVSWIIHWFVSTRAYPQIVVTAGTETQLNTKTWRELAKWHQLSIHRDWFEWTATKFYNKKHPETWFASAIPWNANRPDAFQGTHEKNVLVIFDEASDIADVIWETIHGALSTPGAIWLAFGNPTKNTGQFKECFGRFRHRWITRQIDSRTAKKVDKKAVEQDIEDYGEDSDLVRVRWRGLFPRAGSTQFIPEDMVERCMAYRAEGFESQPKILGVDVARFGDDMTVLTLRQGRKVWGQSKYRGLDTMQTASRVAEMADSVRVQLIFVDGVGVGGGVVDRLRQLGYGHRVLDVNAGGKAVEENKYFNRRAEMWGRMKDWLKDGAELPADVELRSDLTSVEYGYTGKQQIQLEKKEDMKRRGLCSPDCGDSLALTFSQGNVVNVDMKPLRLPSIGVV